MNIELTKKTEISKADIVEMSSQLIEKLDTGELNPFLLSQHLKAIEKVSESIKAKLTDALVAEAQKHPKGPIMMFGAEFKLTEAGVSYDFSGCGDPVYAELVAEMDDVKKRLKDRENFLKAINGHETVINESTAEICTVYPPVRKSSTIVQCSIK